MVDTGAVIVLSGLYIVSEELEVGDRSWTKEKTGNDIYWVCHRSR